MIYTCLGVGIGKYVVDFGRGVLKTPYFEDEFRLRKIYGSARYKIYVSNPKVFALGRDIDQGSTMIEYIIIKTMKKVLLIEILDNNIRLIEDCVEEVDQKTLEI